MSAIDVYYRFCHEDTLCYNDVAIILVLFIGKLMVPDAYSPSVGFLTASISNQKSLPWPTLLLTP